MGFGTKRVLVFKPMGEKEWWGMHRIAMSMERWFSDVKKDLWNYCWNCTSKAPETKCSIKKCHSSQKRVTAAIWQLATGDSYRAVGKTFRIGKLTAVSITHDFYKELFRISRRFIRFLKSRSETCSAIPDFKEETNCKIPQALGVSTALILKYYL